MKLEYDDAKFLLILRSEVQDVGTRSSSYESQIFFDSYPLSNFFNSKNNYS